MNIQDAILNRRSHFVKEFTGQNLPGDFVEDLVKKSLQVPNHKLTHPWRFGIFGGESKNGLCTVMEDYYMKNTATEDFRQEKLDKIRLYKNQISHIVSIGYVPSGRVPEWEELASTAMVVQNMYLLLSAHPHFAGYWTTGNGTGSNTMKKCTGLPENGVQLGFLFLGYVENKRTRTSEHDLSGVVSWI